MASTTTNPDLTPAMSPPPGVKSILVDPPSQGYKSIIVVVILLALTTPLIFIRLYTRRIISRQLWWDDYTAVLGWVGFVGFSAIMFNWLKYGSGTDLWNVSVSNYSHFKQNFLDLEIVARISVFFTKTSILLMFLHIFYPTGARRGKNFYAIWFVILFNLLYCIALVLLVLLQCVGKKIKSKCVNEYFVLITASLINVLSDIAMLIIPLIAVWDLHASLKRKLRLLAVFAVGLIAITSSLARLGWQIQQADDPNQTVILMVVGMLALAEQAAGIVVSCMPLLPAFFRYVSNNGSMLQASKSTGSSSWRTGFRSNSFIPRKPRSGKMGINDTTLSTRGFKELDNNLENGYELEQNIQGTTTKIEGGRETPLVSEDMDHVFDRPVDTNAVVSRSVQVESRPYPFKEGLVAPQSQDRSTDTGRNKAFPR